MENEKTILDEIALNDEGFFYIDNLYLQHDYEKFIDECNNIDRQDSCEYCQGPVKHIQYGYKMDEVGKQCEWCGMFDPR